jgi:MFS family permease
MNALTDRTRPTQVRYHVLVWLCVAAAIAYVDRSCIAVAQKVIGADLELNDEAMGNVMSAFFLTYTLFQLPAGWLSQAWGTRRSLSLFAAAWSAATGAAALVSGFPGLLVSRLGMGAAEAGIFPCAISTLARWFPVTQRAWVSGVLGAFVGIGGALGAALTGLLLMRVDWRWMFALYAALGLAWATWFYWWFRDRPEQHPHVNAAELEQIRQGTLKVESPKKGNAPVPTPWRQILTSPTMWWINAQQFFRAAGQVFYISWFPTYLMETRGVDTSEAGILTSVTHGAQILGSLAGGALADWILLRTGSRRLSRQGLPVVSLVVCTALIGGSYFATNAWLAVLLICLGTLTANLAGPCAYAVTIDLGGDHVAPVFSVMNMAGNIGAILFPVIVPRLVHVAGSWDLAFVVFVLMHLAAAVFWLLVSPNSTIVHPVSKE